MEQNCLKTNVYVNENIVNESAEQPIDVDFTLPDFCPDISKIFKCRAVSRISSKGINGRTVNMEGSVCITLLYADSDAVLRSYEYQYPFSKSIEVSEDCTGGNLCCHTRCEYINCRAVTGRKIDIHGAIGIYYRVFRRRATEIISDIDDPNIELRHGTAPATTPMGYAEKYLVIEEDVELGQGQPPIESLLRYDANACIRESKIINDKIIVKGDLIISALYCSEDGNSPQLLKSSIPFSQIIEMEGVSENCECDIGVEVAFIELKPRTSAAGEARSLQLGAKLLITAEAYCNNDIAVVLDAYSRKYQAEISRSKICFEKITENICETYHCKKNISVDSPINSVSDLWCDVQNINTKCESDCISVSGSILVGIIVSDAENEAGFKERSIDFEYKYSLTKPLKMPRCNPQIEVASCGYTITGPDNIELRIDLSINAAVYECSNVPLIIDMNVDHSKPSEKTVNSAMIIYFADSGEFVWDIARRYSASVNDVMKINGLENDEISEQRMIMIPIQ